MNTTRGPGGRPAAAVGLVLLAVALGAHGQADDAAANADDTYRPLFTPDMIQAADPAQANRMRATEERNREAYEQRQREQGEQRRASTRKTTAPSPAPRKTHGKIYRWVDKDGNVNFGDAPRGGDATEVQVGGAARVQGNPLPPPTLTGGER